MEGKKPQIIDCYENHTEGNVPHFLIKRSSSNQEDLRIKWDATRISPPFFNIFINDLGDEMEVMLIIFLHDKKLGRIANFLKGRNSKPDY